MDKKLNIQLFVHPNCKLVAVDHSDYSSVDLLDHVAIEFLSYAEETSPLSNTIKVYKTYNRNFAATPFSSEFTFEVDGTYAYYKLSVPLLEHLKIEGEEKYRITDKNELFFYDDVLYKCKLDDISASYDLSEIINNSDQIENYLDAYDIVQKNGASQTLYYPKEIIFSVCKLQKCLVSLQRKLLPINSSICGFDKCITDETLRNRRDFLLSALYVFDYLKDTGNFTEAQRILNNLSTCDSLCDDELANLNNDCGCGNFV